MNLHLVDIGANLTNKAFRGDREAVLVRAAEAGVAAVLVTGVSARASREAWEIAADHRAPAKPRLYATAGIHPHHASTIGPEAIAEVRALLDRPEVVAVGECGLDYNRDFSPRDVQRRCFEALLEIAAEVKKPVFLHERDATDDFVTAVARWRPRLPAGGVVHCFTGDRAALQRYLDLDLCIGITGWICDDRRGAHLRDLVKRVPAGRLLVETDAPYLFPRDLLHVRGGHPVELPPSADSAALRERHVRGGRNEPALLPHIARAVAAHRGETVEELARHTTAAASALFGIRV
jgi:TatD DNase family protein